MSCKLTTSRRRRSCRLQRSSMTSTRWRAAGCLSVFVALAGWAGVGRASKRVSPEVDIHESRIDGHANATSVLTRTAKQKLGPVQRCYRKELESRPTQLGELPLRVTVLPNGRISAVKIRGKRTVSTSLFACVSSAVRKWTLTPWRPDSKLVGRLEYRFYLTAPVPKGMIVKGGLEPKQAAGVFAARKGELRECFSSPPSKHVRLEASVHVGHDGKVTRARVSGRSVKYSTKRCMGSKILGWRFPGGRTGRRTWMQYPLVFRPRVARPHSGRTGAARRAKRRRASAASPTPSRKWVVPMTSVRITQVKAKGSLSSKRVRRVLVAGWVPKMKACLAKKVDPGQEVEGTLGMSFVIAAKSGRTKNVQVTFAATEGSRKARRAVKKCGADALRPLVFGRPSSRRRKKTTVTAKSEIAVEQTNRKPGRTTPRPEKSR